MAHDFKLSVKNGAIIALIGFILSSLVAIPIVMFVSPQPMWQSVELFRAHFHTIQVLPYYFGFILISGLVILVYGHRQEKSGQHSDFQDQLRMARVLINIFATLIIFNYSCQTTFVPHLVQAHNSLYDPLIAAFSMSNPDSLSWTIEMWGYLILAKALWLLSGFYREKRTSLPGLLTINLIISVLSLLWSILDPSWVDTTLGLILYFTWNGLMIVILILMVRLSKFQYPLPTV